MRVQRQCFFLQAEDGIRDADVTGVQTCALPISRDWGPLPYALSVAAGDAESVDDLAELVGDGIYVTRLYYLGVVHPREGVVTGMTRDGTFRIRNGKVGEPLVNLRFTVAVPEFLREVYGLTDRVSLVNSQNFYG